MTTGVDTTTDVVQFTLLARPPGCHESKESILLVVPALLNGATTSFYAPQIQTYIDPQKEIQITGSLVCDLSDLEITTSFVTSAGDGNWFLYDNNPETYVEQEKLADGSFNFEGGLPVLAEFQVGRYREIITVFLDLKISNSVLTLTERIVWDLVVEEGVCKTLQNPFLLLLIMDLNNQKAVPRTSQVPTETTGP